MGPSRTGPDTPLAPRPSPESPSPVARPTGPPCTGPPSHPSPTLPPHDRTPVQSVVSVFHFLCLSPLPSFPLCLWTSPSRLAVPPSAPITHPEPDVPTSDPLDLVSPSSFPGLPMDPDVPQGTPLTNSLLTLQVEVPREIEGEGQRIVNETPFGRPTKLDGRGNLSGWTDPWLRDLVVGRSRLRTAGGRALGRHLRAWATSTLTDAVRSSR